MLFFKQSYSSALSLAVLAGASATNLNLRENGRSLQASIGCIVGGKSFIECCPSADPTDGVCTVLWCVDLSDVTIRDNCDCAQIETACGQVASFAALVDGLADMCAAVDNCCGGDGTDNGEFDTCMDTAINAGNFTVPDFDTIIPGGIPDLSGGGGNATDVAATMTTVPPTEPATTEAVVTESALVDVVESTEPSVANTTDVATTVPTVPETASTEIVTEATEPSIAKTTDVATEAPDASSDTTTMATAALVAAVPVAVEVTKPPASIACMAGGKPFTDCCPTADPDDGVCTILWCYDLDEVSIRDNCGCGQIETACGQVALFSGVVEGLAEMCASVDNCCVDDTTDNDKFDTCMSTAISNGDFTVPDLDKIIPGGIPDLGGDDAAITDEPEASTTTTSTVAPGTDGSKDPDDTNDASKYAAGAMTSLIGSSLAMIFV